MANKAWTFKLKDGDHTVQVEHSYWSGKRTVLLDGTLILKENKFIDFGSDHPLNIYGHKGLLRIRTSGLTYNYDLAIDGKSVTSGQPIVPAAPLPSWAWAFIVACVLIPVVSLGGAVPTAIGAGGALVCISTAKDVTRDARSRISICLGITLLCWAIFITFIWLISGLVTHR